MTDLGEGNPGAEDDDSGPVPFWQAVLDNPFLLLVIGVTMPSVFYLIWGIVEITAIPVAP